MLALIWATRHYRCYLLGLKFTVRKEHAALTYLRKFADHNARLMRWSLKLAEFEFSIEHRAGKKIPPVDVLSRHVGAVLQRRLDPETVKQEQGKDKYCRSLKPRTHSSESEFFVDKKVLPYRRMTQERHQLVVSKSLISEVIKLNHDPVYIAHPGVKRTHDLVALNFWWPGMRGAIKKYIPACHACQRGKEGREFKAPLREAE
jgi:hypothetical protein